VISRPDFTVEPWGVTSNALERPVLSQNDGLRFAPRLPEKLTRLTFGIRVHGGPLRVRVEPDSATYSWDGGSLLRLRHFGEGAELEPGSSRTLRIPPPTPPEVPLRQPRGRAPRDLIHRNGD